jgi:hypothetical protein
MVALLDYLSWRCLPVTSIDGLELHPVQQSGVRRGHMEIEFIHVDLTDAQFAGRPTMGLWRLVDSRDTWRRLVS